MNIKDIIDDIERRSKNEKEFIDNIYLFFLEEEKRSRPWCGTLLWSYIFIKCYNFKKASGSSELSLWLTEGFISDPDIGDWEIDINNCSFNLKDL